MFPKSSATWARWNPAAVHPSKLPTPKSPPKFTAHPGGGFRVRHITMLADRSNAGQPSTDKPDLAFGVSPAEIKAIAQISSLTKAAALPDVLQRLGIVPLAAPKPALEDLHLVSHVQPDPKTTPWLHGTLIEPAKATLGTLREGHARILLTLVEAEARYAPPSQVPFNIDTADLNGLHNHLTQAIANPAQPLRMMKKFLTELARYEATGDPGVENLSLELSFCRDAASLVAVAAAYFTAGPDGFLSFRSTPPEETDATLKGLRDALKAELAEATKKETAHLDALRKSPNYADFLKASGLDATVFERIARGLLARGLIFEAIFHSKDDHRWGVDWFGHLGERLKTCHGDEGVACTLYFKDTYIPGPITHVAMAAFSAQGDVLISHQETIPYGKPGMVEGITLATAGLPADSFDTTDLFTVIQNRDAKNPIKREELPIFHSYIASGPPLAQFTTLRSFSKARDFVERAAAQSRSALGIKWLYGVDPSQPLGELVGAVRKGKIPVDEALLERFRQDFRFGRHGALPPPGAVNDFVPGMYVNNCGYFTVLTLKAGNSPALDGWTYHDDMDLTDMAAVLIDRGLSPNTDPAIVHWMREAGVRFNAKTGRAERHPGSFLILGSRYGWGNAAPGTPHTYAAHVERNPPKDPKEDAAARAKAIELGQKQAEAGRASFAAVADLNLPKWVVRVLTAEDWPMVEALINSMSDDDVYYRWFTFKPAAIAKEQAGFPGGPKHPSGAVHFGVFDPTGTSLIAYGDVAMISAQRATAGLITSPHHRQQGCGKFAMGWVVDHLRNRGVTELETFFSATNRNVYKLLSSLKLAELPPDPTPDGFRKDYTTCTVINRLDPPDSKSMAREEQHRRISSGWKPPVKH